MACWQCLLLLIFRQVYFAEHRTPNFSKSQRLDLENRLKAKQLLVGCTCKKYRFVWLLRREGSCLAALQNISFNWPPMGRSSFVFGLGSIVNFVCSLFTHPIPLGLPRAAQPCSQSSLLPTLRSSVGRVGENPGNEVESCKAKGRNFKRWRAIAKLTNVQFGPFCSLH